MNFLATTYLTLNWSLQPLSQDYDLIFHNTHVGRDNFIHDLNDLQFKIVSERRKAVERKPLKEVHFLISLCSTCLSWGLKNGHTPFDTTATSVLSIILLLTNLTAQYGMLCIWICNFHQCKVQLKQQLKIFIT